MGFLPNLGSLDFGPSVTPSSAAATSGVSFGSDRDNVTSWVLLAALLFVLIKVVK